MKKYIILTIAVIGIVLVGCSSNKTAGNSEVKMKANVADKPFTPGAAEITAIVDKIENKNSFLIIKKIHKIGRQTPNLNKGNTVVVSYKLDKKLEAGKLYKFKIQSSAVPGSDKIHWSVTSVEKIN